MLFIFITKVNHILRLENDIMNAFENHIAYTIRRVFFYLMFPNGRGDLYKFSYRYIFWCGKKKKGFQGAHETLYEKEIY